MWKLLFFFLGRILRNESNRANILKVLEALTSVLPSFSVESHSAIAVEFSKQTIANNDIMPAKYVIAAFKPLLERLEGAKCTVSVFEMYKSFSESCAVLSDPSFAVFDRLSVMFSFFEHTPFPLYAETLRSYLPRANKIIGLAPDSKPEPSPSLIRLHCFWAELYCLQHNFARASASLISAVEAAHALGDPKEMELAENAAATAVLAGASRNKTAAIAKCLNNETIARCSLVPLLNICAKNQYIWHTKNHAELLPKLQAALTPLEKKIKTNAGLDLATASILAHDLAIVSRSFHNISLKDLSHLFSLSISDTVSFIAEVITDSTCCFCASIDAVEGFVNFVPAKDQSEMIKGFEQHTAVTEAIPFHSDSDFPIIELSSSMDAAISATEDLYSLLSSKQ